MFFSVILQVLILAHLIFGLPEDVKPSFSVGQGVQTSSGLLLGKAAANRSTVSEYLGIPFAKPPVGDLRFAAPQEFAGSATINATSFSPWVSMSLGKQGRPKITDVYSDCPANTQSGSGVPAGLAGPNSLRLLAQVSQLGDNFSEDCLTLNIWTKPQTGEKAKAVLFWIYGGGFQTGNTNNPVYNGQYLADSDDVVVVSANYRVNVFGFPGLPGMDQNVGLLDQRLAVEWARKNIAAFGGDPNRITIFGQSAGAASVDYYSYAWTSDPIVNAFIEESGTATSFTNPAPSNNTAFWFNATEELGCGGASAGILATVRCMRTKSYQQILNATASPPGLSAVLGQFGPTVDNKTVFSNYTKLAAAGQYIQKPYLIGNNDYEAGLFKIVAATSGTTLPDLYWAIFNLASFTCPSARTTLARSTRVPTYRYRYFGEFPNVRLTLKPNSGAWHGSEIGQIFQTTPDASGEADTPAEASISTYVSGAWVAFAKNPILGLSQPPYSWPTYNATGDTLIKLAYNNETTASYTYPVTYDAACPVLDPLLASLPGGLAGLGSANASTLGLLGQISNLTALGGGSEVGFKM